MTISQPVFTLSGTPVDVEGWQFSDSEGGYDQFSGAVTDDAYRRAGSPTQGAVVAAYDKDEVRWIGRLAAPPQIKGERAMFNAVGYKEAAAKRTQRLLFQSADLSQWVSFDADPHNTTGGPQYDHSRKWNLETTNHALRFTLDRNQTLALNDGASAIFYAEGVDVQRVKWTQDYNVADEFAKLEIKVQRAVGPIGAATNVTTGGAPVALNTANNGTSQDISHALTGNDLILLMANCNDGTFTPNANKMVWTLSQVRVNSSITSADSYNAYEVVTYIAGQMGWTTTGVTSSTFDIMPLDWIDGTWLDAMLYVAELEDKYVRVGNNAVEYGAWGTTNWQVTQTAGANPDLKPLELFNQARVTYETAAGVKRKKSRTTSDVSITDPLATAGITNTFEYELEDRQRNGTLAQNVADKLVTRFSTQRYAGSIQVVSAISSNGRDNPRGIRYGDTITIQDWGPGESKVLRVMEVSQDKSGVTVGVEQPVNLAALIAHTSGRRHRKKRPKTLAGSYVGM